MNSKATLKKYLGISATAPIIAILFAAICLASIIGSIIANSRYEVPEPVKFDPLNTPTGVYAYIDVIAVTDWIYQTESDSVTNNYYVAADSDNLYTVNLYDHEFEAMSAQYEYGLSDDPDAPVPTPYRLCGLSESMGSELAGIMARQFGISDADEYRAVMGKYILNAKSQPSSSAGGMLIILAIITGMATLIIVVLTFPKRRMFKKTINRLVETGELDKAADQLYGADNITYPVQGITLSHDYIFSKSGKVVLRYSDIFWSYMRTQRVNFIKVGEYLIGNTVELGSMTIAAVTTGKKNAGILEQIIHELEKRNPQMLVGYMRDNIDAYHNAVAQARQRTF